MRLDINLASQPYEDARRFWMVWGLGVGAVLAITLVMLSLTVTGLMAARRDHAAMAAKRALIAERDQKRASAEEFLNRPENRSTRDESQFLNALIERKSFSWTQVLENLEKVMPPRVHLVSISPGLDDENQLQLKMSVAGNSRDRAIELAHRMEDSHRFTETSIVSEQNTQNVNGDTEQFDIIAVYIPEPPAAEKPEKTEPAPKTEAPKKSDTPKGAKP